MKIGDLYNALIVDEDKMARDLSGWKRDMKIKYFLD